MPPDGFHSGGIPFTVRVTPSKGLPPAWMSQEVSKWLVNGL